MMGKERRTKTVDHPVEVEPEGFAEAVAAGALTLALMVSLAAVGFAWERRQERVAHAYAISLVDRLAADGSDAHLPPWSGFGQGPGALTAKATFEALRRLGGVTADPGHCALASRFSVCSGSRYSCQVTGGSASGPIAVSVGLCQGGSGAAWTFDTLHLTVPTGQGDAGNRDMVVQNSDGAISYGTRAPPPDALPVRGRRRGFAMPFLQ